MAYHTYFNRHQNFNKEMLTRVRQFIDLNTNKYGLGLFGKLNNYLYGLYDGFLYQDLLVEAHKVYDKEDFAKLLKLYLDIDRYPKTETDTTEH